MLRGAGIGVLGLGGFALQPLEVGQLKSHSAGQREHGKPQRDSGRVGKQRHGRVWEIRRISLQPEHVAIEREGGVEIVHRMDGMREGLGRGRGLRRHARYGCECDRGQNQTEPKFLHGAVSLPLLSRELGALMV